MKKRGLSIFLALVLCLSLLPTAVWAVEPDAAVWTVTAFDTLAADVARQTLSQPAEDGADEGPNLPDALKATAYQGVDEPQAVDIAVTWAAAPKFDPATPGDYIYTPALPEGYALAEGVELPAITVTVEAAPPQDEPVAQDAGDSTAGNWADAADTDWYTSDTSASDTYTISAAAQLAGLAKLVNEGNSFSGKTITLDAEIDLNGKEWTPIGTDRNSFQGIFDGSGKAISNLTVSTTSDYAGLFGYVGSGGTVQNVNVVNGNVTGGNFTGGVVGINYGTVTNCSFSGAVSGTMYTGGIVGNNLNGKVTSCHNAGTVTSTGGDNTYAGGVVGQNGGEVTACYNTGTLRAEGNSKFFRGGVVGFNANTVQNCYNIGTVTDPYITDKTGGVIGQKSTYAAAAVATNCYFLEWQEMSDPSLKGIGEDGSESGSNTGAEPKTADAFAGGEVAWLLSGGDTQDPNSPWRQNLGSADADSSPVLDSTHARVYYDVDNDTYTNEDQSGKWDGAAKDTSWYDETQTEFTITTAAQLAGFAQLVNSGTTFSGKTVYLGAEIDLRSQTWTPIGKYTDDSWKDPAFQGTFNGNGKTVSGLCVNITATGKTSGGLFGYVKSGTVQNVNVEGTVTVTSTSSIYVGGVVGYAGTGSTVENCSFSGDVTGPIVGGVVGKADEATIKNCFHSGTVTGSSTSGGYAGGVVGYARGTTVNNCYNTGKVSNTSDAGKSGLSVSVGGVVGSAGVGSSVNNCYNTGVVESTHTSPSQHATSHDVGGVAGYAGNATVKNCYNTGTVTGTSTSTGTGTVSTSVGGVVGANGDGTSSATVSNCYFLDGTASQGVGSGLSSSTSEKVENKDSAAFASGEVAYLLSLDADGNQDPNSPWRQNLGSAGDTAPTLDSTHARVYCDASSSTYTNVEVDTDGYYQIKTAEDLAAFAALVNSGQNTINAKLVNNIDLSTVCGATIGENGAAVSWTPIGNSSNSFQGTFDGQGHTVSGLYMDITRNDSYSTYGGLFGNVKGGTVKNLNVNGTVTVTNKGSRSVYVGGVVGMAYQNTTVENCSFTGEVTGTSGYSIYVGGVVSRTDMATVRGCSNSGKVTANSQTYNYTGGVVGRAYQNTTVENCYNTGAVTGTGSGTFYVGGVAGYIYYTITVENCYNTGTVSGPSGGNVGGVVGGAGYAANYPSTVKNCYFLQDTGTNTGLSGIGYDETSSTSGQSSNDGATPKTADAFASGEVAYLLQAGQTAGEDGSIPQVWGQTLVGDTKDAAPVLTSDAAKSVVAVTFMVKSDTENGYTEHAAKYTNKGGTVALPTAPTAPATRVFSGWYISDTALTEANRFTESTTVAADTPVYAGMQLQYGAAEGDNTVNTTYGVGATADLSKYIAYADDATSVAKNFSYTITSGNDGKYFSIDGDTLTVSNTTPASTYTLTITAKEKTPQITLLSTYSFGTSDVTFTVTVVVAKATPEVTAPTANTLTYTGNAQALVTAGSATGGTLQYSTDGTTYSAAIPTGTKADTYTVYYKVVGDANHNDTEPASVPVTIAKATPTYVAPTGLTAVSGQTLASVKLPNGWTWVDDTLRVGTADTNTFSATYTPSDTNNYNTVTVGVTVTTVAEVNVGPGETVQIGDTIVTNNDGTVTVQGEDGTKVTVTLPEESDSVTVDGDENVTVPDGTTVQTGDGPVITLPDGGTVDGDGNVTGKEVQIGDTTITAPEGSTVTTKPDGTTTAPSGSTVEVGETTITIGEDTNGATVDENGKITLPSGGTVTVEPEDGETVTITTPEGGEITVNKGEGETTLTVPDGTTVQTGTGPEITLPEGGKVAEDGSVTAETVQVGDTTITAPEGKTVTTTPDGTTTAPGGSTVEIGETKITIGEDTTATVDENGNITLPSGGTATVKTQDGITVTITAPEGGGTVTVDDEGNLLLPGGSTVTIGGTESTIPESGGALDPATGQITYNTYLVTFNSQGGSQVAAQTVTAGGTVKQPASPTRTGYTFAGWYKDAACQTPWNFTTDTVTGDLTLYAKWTVKSTTPTYTPTVSQPENGTVTITPANPKQGATVTITPKPNTGYEVDTITVTDKNGSPVAVTNNGDGTYSFTQPASRVTVAVTFTETKQPAPDLPFTDVAPTAWYAEAVSYMLERGLMTGTAPDTFSPNSTTTRAMIVTILYRLEGEPSATGNASFADVEMGTWYTEPIAWAAANGVVEGITPTTFAPNAPVTREQMATILYRYLAAKGYDVTARADLSAYTDANQVSSYATEAMSWANALGLITGDTPATLTPQGNATRAQVATILMRFCESLEK